MKNFTFLLAICLSFGVFAQNRLHETFEKIESNDAFPPYGWLNIDADGDGNLWGLSAIGDGENGTSGAISWSWNWDALLPDNYLVTPKLIVKTGDSLKFYMASFDTYAESYQVRVSTTGTDVEDFTEIVDEFVFSADTIKLKRSISLEAYVGKEIYIAFRHNTPTSYLSLTLDNVEGPETVPFAKELSLTQFVNLQEHGCDVEAKAVSVLVENFGTEDYTDFVVNCRMISTKTVDYELVPDSITPIFSQKYQGTLKAGEKDTIHFGAEAIFPYDLYTGSVLTFAWLSAQEDEYHRNDTLVFLSEFQKSLSLPLHSGFESENQEGENDWANWVSVNASTEDVASMGWAAGSNPAFVRTGGEAAVFNVDAWGDESYSPYTGDKHYLATPCLYLEADKEYQIQFNAIFNYGKRVFFKLMYGPDQRHILENGTEISTTEFVNNLAYQTIGSKKFSVSKSGSYFIGIMAYSQTPISDANRDSAFLIFLDDFLIRDAATKAPIDLSIESISIPYDCNLGSSEELSVSYSNASLDAISSYKLRYSINGAKPVVVDMEAPLAAQSHASYTFDSPIDLSKFGSHSIKVSIEYEGTDVLESNNSKTISTKNVEPVDKYVDSFEDYFTFDELNEEWYPISYGKNVWQVSEDTDPEDGVDFAYTGSAFLSHSAWRSQANEWLISKCINAKKGTKYTVSFAYRGDNEGSTEKAKLAVYLLSGYDHDAKILEIFKNEDIKNNEYKVHKYEYTPMEDEIIHIGFHAYSSYDPMADVPVSILIDDVKFQSGISIEESQLSDSFKTYPNPVKDKLYIECDQDIQNISIFSVIGTKVLEKQIGGSSSKTSISTENLPNGLYLIQVQTANKTSSQKIIVK